MFKSLTPNIIVTDVNATVKWYEENLNFKFANQDDTLDKPLEWAMVQAGEVTLFFQQKESLVKEIPALIDQSIGASMTLYIKVENVQELFDSIKGKVEIVLEMKETFYGAKEFGIKDLNGYILVFSEINN